MEPKEVGRLVRDHFGGGKAKVAPHGNDDVPDMSLHILYYADSPIEGVTSFATLGAGQYDNAMQLDDGLPVRIELLGACQSNFPEMANVLATCAFNVATRQSLLGRHVIHPGAVSTNANDVRMRHAFFVEPFLWGDGPSAVYEKDRVTTWLQVVPIDDLEFTYAREHGGPALGQLFEDVQIDVFDMNRPSAVSV